jgi:hypothetical protein
VMMLVYQGAKALEIWTGKKAPVDVMERAVREALAARRAGQYTEILRKNLSIEDQQ